MRVGKPPSVSGQSSRSFPFFFSFFIIYSYCQYLFDFYTKYSVSIRKFYLGRFPFDCLHGAERKEQFSTRGIIEEEDAQWS